MTPPSKYPSYPQYKPSGIPWLGNVPSGWEVQPLGTQVSENKVYNHSLRENNVLSLSYGKIVRRDVSTNFGLLPESFDTYQIVNSGDIVLRLTDLQNDQRSLRVGLVTERGIITSAYIGLKVYNIYPLYCYFLLHSYDLSKVFYTFGGGVRQSMRYEDLKKLSIPVPPLEEQHAIATFLDRETAKIDALIAMKRRLLELLSEKRQALISHAVTKGLNPHAPMKDSGVEWLGNVPNGWDVVRLKDICQVNPSKRSITLSDDTLVSFLPMEKLSEDGNLTLDLVKPIAEVRQGFTYFQDMDVIVAKITPCFEKW